MISFKQDQQGQWWFIGLYSNKYQDKEREIISEQAHLDYVQWVQETGLKPPITLFHMPRAQPGFWVSVLETHRRGLLDTKSLNRLLQDFYAPYALGETEKVFYTSGFVGVIAKVYDEKKAWVQNLLKYPHPLGMSHGFIPMAVSDNIYTKYRTFEMSILPRSRVANEWTRIMLMEDKMALAPDVREFLEDIREGTADEIETQTEEQRQALEDAGVDFKALDETPLPETEPETPEEDKAQAMDLTGVLEQLVQVMKWDDFVVALQDRLSTMEQRFETMETQLKALEQTEDEKVAALYQPNWQQLLNPVREEAPPQEQQKEQSFDFLAQLMSQPTK